MTYIFKNDSFLSFRCTSEEFHNFFTNIVFRIDMRNLMRNIRLTGDSSSLTVVRMTSLVISNVCERYYVSLLGRRIFGAIHLRMTYFLTRDSSRQISCYYCLAWDSSLHDRFVQNDGQMSFRANARNPPILPFCLRYFVLFANDAGFSVGFFLFAVINMIIRWQSIKQRRGYLHLCKQPLFSLRIHLK